jgi:ParB-like chromosome segregation protein Spo0J
MSDIKSKNIELVDIDSIIPNPKNANRHSIEQIKRLEKLIKYQGFRNPLIVSNRTGFLVVGHGRLEAAKNLGIEKLPVIKQDFESEAQEYAYLISDNEIQRWSELDKQAVFDEIENMPELNIELLAIENFSLEKPEQKEDKPVDLSFEYKLEVDCNDEEQQNYLMGELQDRGYEVRVLL